MARRLKYLREREAAAFSSRGSLYRRAERAGTDPRRIRLSPLEELHLFDDDPVSRHKRDLDIPRRESSPERWRNPWTVSPARRVQEKARPANADRREFYPVPGYTGSDVYGGRAKISVSPDIDRSAFIYARPELALPCIWRSQRREVLFAIKKAGKGHRTKKRRNETSNYECV